MIDPMSYLNRCPAKANMLLMLLGMDALGVT